MMKNNKYSPTKHSVSFILMPTIHLSNCRNTYNENTSEIELFVETKKWHENKSELLQKHSLQRTSIDVMDRRIDTQTNVDALALG